MNDELLSKLETMGRRAASLIGDALRTIEEQDESYLSELARHEEEVHELQDAIHRTALQRAGREDAAFLGDALRAASELERVADKAILIAQISHHLVRGPVPDLGNVRQLGSTAQSIVRRAMEGFLRSDADLADSVRGLKDRLETYRNLFFHDLLDLMMTHEEHMAAALAWNLIVRNLEGVGEHAQTIAGLVPVPAASFEDDPYDDFLRS